MRHYVLDNAVLWVGDGTSLDGHLVIDDGVIESVGTGHYQGNHPVIGLEGISLSPGIIDFMIFIVSAFLMRVYARTSSKTL
ncbi:MAG: hypothetical protein ACYTF1_01775 [Planctomycetota bacterium]|jgi:cytosine/adenosine deaminase-related metal-dependent hydrolase